MKLCECGCGKEVKCEKSKFCSGHNSRSIESKEKYKQTCLLKYGVENVAKSEIIQEQKKRSSLERTGFESSNQIPEIKEKKRKIFFEKFGGPAPYSSEEVRKRGEKTCLEHCGETSNLKNKEWQEKNKLIMIERHGVDNIFKDVEYIKECVIKKHGVDNIMKLPYIVNKSKQTCEDKYGVSNWNQSSQGLLFHREDTWKRIECQKLNDERLCPCVGPKERLCLNIIQLKFNNYIERQPNIGWYFPDGRILYLRLLIEYDESGHYNKGYYSKDDLDREEYLIGQGYIMFRIKEIDWENKKEWVLEQLRSLIQNLTEEYIGKEF